MSESRVYRAHVRYGLWTALGAMMTLLFAWTLARDFAPDTLLFLVISLAFTLVNLRWWLTKVEVTPRGVIVRRPGQRPQEVAFRQLVDVHEGGRLARSTSLVYYPVDPESGLVQMDRPESLFLPGVEGQEELVRALEQRIP